MTISDERDDALLEPNAPRTSCTTSRLSFSSSRTVC